MNIPTDTPNTYTHTHAYTLQQVNTERNQLRQFTFSFGNGKQDNILILLKNKRKLEWLRIVG